MPLDLRYQGQPRDLSGIQDPLYAATQTALPQLSQSLQMMAKMQQQKKMTDWLNSLGQSQDPQMQRISQFAPLLAQNPEMAGQILPEIMKSQKAPLEWGTVSGMMSKGGHPLEIDKSTGQMREVSNIDALASGGSQMAGVREKQFGLQDLPSNQPPTTAGGAAYQVKVAARQGKNLIAKPGSAQRTGLAVGDLARAILRAAPTDEAMKNGNFSDNLITHWSLLKQKITADPNTVNNPQIRRELYSIFDEMDKSATPFIKNQLDDMESMGFKVPPAVRKRQMGETLPDVPFLDMPGQGNPFKNPNDFSGMSDDELRKIAAGGR